MAECSNLQVGSSYFLVGYCLEGCEIDVSIAEVDESGNYIISDGYEESCSGEARGRVPTVDTIVYIGKNIFDYEELLKLKRISFMGNDFGVGKDMYFFMDPELYVNNSRQINLLQLIALTEREHSCGVVLHVLTHEISILDIDELISAVPKLRDGTLFQQE